jgi:hypothetical protein
MQFLEEFLHSNQMLSQVPPIANYVQSPVQIPLKSIQLKA